VSVLTAAGTRRRYWRDVARIHRVEYPFPIVYLCHGYWGATLAGAGPRQLAGLPVIAAAAASILPIMAMNALNSATDIASDSVNPGKTWIAGSTARIGVRQAVWWSVGGFATALGLALAVSVPTGRPWVIAAVAGEVALWLAYILEPVRLKRRGFLNPLTYSFTLAVLPCLASYNAVRPDITGWVLLVWAGLGALLAGRTLWWLIPDHRADAAVGDRTPAVVHGARRALAFACAMTALGAALAGAGVWWGFGPLWALAYVASAGLFLTDKLVLLRRITDDDTPDEKRMRSHTLTLVAVSDVLLVLIPLLAGA
jgi:lycopene elongase/hydratase (dihydrobisanhydrobacterioruberin-forming)